MIRIRFVTCDDVVSRIIRGAQMGFWASHVEADIGGSYLGAHASGGVAIRPYSYDDGQWTQQLFVEVPTTWSWGKEQEAKFLAFLHAQVGKGYDFDALGEMAIGVVRGEAPNWTLSTKWICSALITGALVSSGVIKAAPTTVRVATPRDVLCCLSGLVEIGEPEAAPRRERLAATSVAPPLSDDDQALLKQIAIDP